MPGAVHASRSEGGEATPDVEPRHTICVPRVLAASRRRDCLDSRLRLAMTAPHYHSHVDDPAAVGRRLKEARVAAGLSQRQLSFPGCSAAYISRLEAGDRVPSLQLLRKLALKLSADEEYLATGVERVEQAPPELVEAEVVRRLGNDLLAK